VLGTLDIQIATVDSLARNGVYMFRAGDSRLAACMETGDVGHLHADRITLQ